VRPSSRRPTWRILAAVHFDHLTPVEQRVLGCLIEKRWTTPDQYPLSLNALRLACNQATNRDPVTDYDEATVAAAAQRLSRYGLARLASGHSSRAVKYRHLAEEGLGLGREPLAVLGVLLLRGPQTLGEIKARTERMAPLGSLAEVELVLAQLSEHGYARALPRRPGQKEVRFEHLLGEAEEETGDAGPRSATIESEAGGPAPASGPGETGPGEDLPVAPSSGGLETRVAALEAEVERLQAELGQLRARARAGDIA
jgi:uncharacterized protein YceH (UPF0502 family)